MSRAQSAPNPLAPSVVHCKYVSQPEDSRDEHVQVSSLNITNYLKINKQMKSLFIFKFKVLFDPHIPLCSLLKLFNVVIG